MNTTWLELNDRQRQYIQAIFKADQEAEEYERSAWTRGRRSQPASIWRWIKYEGVGDSGNSKLRRALKEQNLIDPGTGATFEALEQRGLIDCKYEKLYGPGEPSTLFVKLTTVGRRLVRHATGEKTPKKLPVGILQEWHWLALAKTYAAGEVGVPHGVVGNVRISWKTWLRLMDYKYQGKELPLVEEYRRSTGITDEEIMEKHNPFNEPLWWLKSHHRDLLYANLIRITQAGCDYYRQNWQHYRELYPTVEAPEPAEGE